MAGIQVVEEGPRQTRSQSEEMLKYKSEANRRKTFEGSNWPHLETLSPEKMAAAGWYFEPGSKDTACCVFCRVKLNSWSGKDDPKREHMDNSKYCSFLKNPRGCGNVTCEEQESSSSIELMDVSKQKSGIQPMASHDMDDKMHRVSSFNNWTGSVRARELYEAGFFKLKGTGDKVRCHSCGLVLFGWEKGDNAWVEHYKHNKQCKVLRGRRFYIKQLMNAPEIEVMREKLRKHALSQGKTNEQIWEAFAKGPFMTKDEMIKAIMSIGE